MRPRASSSAFSACVMISPVDPESLVCVSAVYMYCSWVACLRVRPAPLSLQHSVEESYTAAVRAISQMATRRAAQPASFILSHVFRNDVSGGAQWPENDARSTKYRRGYRTLVP